RGGGPPLPGIVNDDLAYRDSTRMRADREYWHDHLAGLAEPVTLAGRTGGSAAQPILVSAELPSATVELLDRTAAEESSSIAPIVVAAFAAYLGAMTDAREVTLGLPVSGRTTATLRRSGGMVANVVPLRLRRDPGMTVGGVLAATGRELTGALRRQRYRQEDIFRDLGHSMDIATSFGPTVNLMVFDNRIHLGPVVGRLHVLTSGLIDDPVRPCVSGRGRAEHPPGPAGEPESLHRSRTGRAPRAVSGLPASLPGGRHGHRAGAGTGHRRRRAPGAGTGAGRGLGATANPARNPFRRGDFRPRCDRADLRGPAARLRRAGCPVEPAGTRVVAPGRRSRAVRGAGPTPLDRIAHRAVGGRQDRCGVPADGPRPSARSHRARALRLSGRTRNRRARQRIPATGADRLAGAG
ncbi:hypothetical protein GL303_24745, partial [Nocardia seriolae]|nr:hypothetical protein [Nocardia seriolae]